MQRDLYNALKDWKSAKKHTPILLRGARQVGKTYLVERFGQEAFEGMTTINFEFTPQMVQCFENLDPNAILASISTVTRQTIVPGRHMLFLDEIQQCPRAILALRYFKEKMPELHVIGAGSLLEFTINDDAFQMPVGRVLSMYVKPLSFREYLLAADYHQMLGQLSSMTPTDILAPMVEDQLQTLLREYLLVGGMPEAASEFLQSRDFMKVQAMQASLLNTYRNDFGKYASKAKHKYLQKMLEQTPGIIGEHFQYSKIDPDMRSRDLKVALELLQNSGVLHQVHHTKASGLPLHSLINDRRFKALFIDVGLANAGSYLDPQIWFEKDIMTVNRGAVAEQFVGQELLAYGSPYFPGQLYYWDSEKKNSTAEIDYVMSIDDHIIPVEVKAGKTGALRSLKQFMEQKSIKLGVRISMKPLSFDGNILSVPLYMIHELPRLVRRILG